MKVPTDTLIVATPYGPAVVGLGPNVHPGDRPTITHPPATSGHPNIGEATAARRTIPAGRVKASKVLPHQADRRTV